MKLFSLRQGTKVLGTKVLLFYGGPQLSRQKKIAHGKSKKLTARTKSSRQEQIAHGKSKLPTAKANHATLKSNNTSIKAEQTDLRLTKYCHKIQQQRLSRFKRVSENTAASIAEDT